MKKSITPVAVKPAKATSGEQKSTRKATAESNSAVKAKVPAAQKPAAARTPVAKASSARASSSRVVDLRTSAGVAALNKVSKTSAAKSKPAQSTAKAFGAKPAAGRGGATRVIDLRTAAGVSALNKASNAPTIKRAATVKAAAPLAPKKTTVERAAVKPATQKSAPAKGKPVAGVPATARKTRANAGAPVLPPQAASTSARTKPLARATKPGTAAKNLVQPNPAVQPKPAKGEIKAKRSRVPADLAAQYGEKTIAPTRMAVKEEAPLRKPRRTAAARAKLQQALAPDEGILARLERARTAGMTKKRVPSRRSKTWRARCGRCGTQSDFSTPAGLCPKCGAILMRDD